MVGQQQWKPHPSHVMSVWVHKDLSKWNIKPTIGQSRYCYKCKAEHSVANDSSLEIIVDKLKTRCK